MSHVLFMSLRSLPIRSITMLILLCSMDVQSQWSSDPSINTPLSVNTARKTIPAIVSDGRGGAIISWMNSEVIPPAYNSPNTRARKISMVGVPQWSADGVLLNDSLHGFPTNGGIKMAPDNAGGAYVFWSGPGTNQIPATLASQYVDSSGATRQYNSPNGTPFSGAFDIASDAVGQLLYAFTLHVPGSPYPDDLVMSSGYISVRSRSHYLSDPHIVSDGYGGSIISWRTTNSAYLSPRVFTQRVSGNGTRRWTNADSVGLALADTSGDQTSSCIVPGPDGGCVVSWTDKRNDTTALYFQKLDSAGTRRWGPSGVRMVTSFHDTNNSLTMIADGSGGAIAVWSDGVDIIAQRVNSFGTPLWGSSGATVCGAPGMQLVPRIISDGSHGAIIVWQDKRSDTSFDIYGQRMTAFGTPVWGPDGAVVSNAAGDQLLPVIAPDGIGGAIVAWQDGRNGGADIFVHHVGANGLVPSPDVSSGGQIVEFRLDQNYPNPFNPSTTINYQLPATIHVTLEVFNLLGQGIATLVDAVESAGTKTIRFDAKGLASGVYLYKLQAGNRVQTKRFVLLK